MMHSKLPKLPTSIFSVMSQMAQEHNAINLSQGFPDFKSDPLLVELVTRAMNDGYNQYAPMPGDFELRKQISLKVERSYDALYEPDSEITITAGATQAIFTVIATLIEKEDEVILFTPAYDCYEPTIRLFGGKPIPIALRAPLYEPDWQEVAARVGPRTKMIIINSPHNPTGTILSKTDMLALQELVVKNNLWVLSDEVYEHIIFDGEQHQSAASFPALKARSFITASFGKTFHNTGWKIGYCLAPRDLMVEFRKVHQYLVFSVNHPIQKALAIYLKTPEHFLSLGSFYQKKRDIFIKGLATSRFKLIPSQGTYFQLLDFSEITEESDIEFAERLTKEKGIATIPTSVFNANGEDYRQLRVCFAKTERTLSAATEILSAI